MFVALAVLTVLTLNLIPNPSFVDGLWKALPLPAGTSSITQDCQQAHGAGNCSARVQLIGVSRVGEQSQRFGINGNGAQYQLSAWASADFTTADGGGEGVDLHIGLDWYADNGTLISQSDVPLTTPGEEWQQTLATVTAPMGAVTAAAYFIANQPVGGIGIVWFSDFDLAPIVNAPPTNTPLPAGN